MKEEVEVSYESAMKAFDKAVEKFKRAETTWVDQFIPSFGKGRGCLAYLQRFTYELGDCVYFTLVHSHDKLNKEILKCWVANSIGGKLFMVDDIVESQATIKEVIRLLKKYNLWGNITTLYVIAGYKRERKYVEAMGLGYCDFDECDISKVKIIYGERIRHTKYLKFDWEKYYTAL